MGTQIWTEYVPMCNKFSAHTFNAFYVLIVNSFPIMQTNITKFVWREIFLHFPTYQITKTTLLSGLKKK